MKWLLVLLLSASAFGQVVLGGGAILGGGARVGWGASSSILAISPSSASLTLNYSQIQQFTANMPVVWSAAGGTIDANGIYTPPNASGNYSVTATAGTQSVSAPVSVWSTIVVGISPNPATVVEGGTIQFSATVDLGP